LIVMVFAVAEVAARTTPAARPAITVLKRIILLHSIALAEVISAIRIQVCRKEAGAEKSQT
jgi:hypothetical protein